MHKSIISKVFGGAALLFMAVTGAQASTLDFTEVGATGIVSQTVINLSNATLTSYGDDMYIGAPGVFGETNNLGIVCASPVGSGNCEEDLQIDFLTVVTDLMFESFGVSAGDSVTVSAYLGASLLGSTVVTTQTTVDFSGFGSIDRLFFADSSTAAGIGWGDFSFNTSVPEPTTLALMGLGLAGIGWKRRKAA
ncbi:MAG: PEP-CTERM sorting domain-containing protein [Sedimenticola sp.]